MRGVRLSRVQPIAVVVTAALAAPASALAGGDGTFSQAPGSPFTVGSTPAAIGVGDFNQDGDQDLAVVDRDSADLSLLLGGPDATFTVAASAVPLPAGGNPRSIVVADFNQDGDPDLAVPSPSANKITILTGSTGAGFSAAQIDQTLAPGDIASADFNQDGDPDLGVVLGQSAGGDAIFVGAAGSTFTPATAIQLGGDQTSIGFADFDQDNDPDGAATNALLLNKVTVRRGAAGAAFASPAEPNPAATGTNPQDLTIADFNGDGDPDIATANESDDASVITGGAGASFANVGTLTAGTGPSDITNGDFNGDGDPDLAIANQTPGQPAGSLSVYLGASGSGFSPGPGSPVAVGAEPLAVASADFNGDDAADLATADGGADTVTVLLGKDTKAPETTIDKGPKGKTDKRKAKIAYSASEAATFECSLKGKGVKKGLRAFSPCGDTKAKYKRLKPGKKKFQVRAVDAAGNADPTPAKLKWKITG